MAARWNLLNRTSDLYIGKSTLLKVFLLGGVVVISVVFSWYTFGVIDTLQQDTRAQVEKYVRLWQLAANSPTSGNELQFIFDEIIVKASFPIVVLDQDRNPQSWRNIPDIAADDDSEETRLIVRKVAENMLKTNGEFPLYFGESHVNYLRYGDSVVINQLKMMPFIEIGIVLAFMLVGIIGFQNIRRSEERYIWVGMAKETAHQLGTPLSALLGWLEVIGADQRSSMTPEDQEQLLDTTIDNMKVDVERLQRVANRFGLIGSVPELTECDVNPIVAEAAEYYRRRLPFEGRGMQLDVQTGAVPPVRLNAELFSWVLENLIKNSIQAVDSKTGLVRVTTQVVPGKAEMSIQVLDNGRGISAAAARKIFRPGFTTKKRGWGMGLTLVKRIVEEYHVGRIWLVKSRPGETLFEIRLPLAREN